MKYFEIDRIKQAIDHLSAFDSNWVIVPLVLAANGASSSGLVNLDEHGRAGTTRFLEKFFSGALIGLPPFDNGKNFLRPKFSELTNSLAGPDDYVVHQRANLWGSNYSSRGFREMRNRGELEGERSSFKVTERFLPTWERSLPDSFHFEELLIWLYAFNGVSESINTWEMLFEDFQLHKLGGVKIDAVFSSRFNTNNDVPWPPVFLPSRLSDEDYQKALLPSRFSSVIPLLATNLEELTTSFVDDIKIARLSVEDNLITRLTASMPSKRFLILTGLAGSGKTKIAQAFARWITPDPGWVNDADPAKGKNTNPYYALVPVGADWTGNENIIGYPYGLDNETYVTRPALELVRHALDPAYAAVPHFLILDEMNLSHVERYFADILSAIESGEEIPLYEGGDRKVDGSPVPRKLRLPDNLFIIGTVNVDETTYMFSPKVLDRANVIEFRLEPDGLLTFLGAPKAPRLEELDGKGASFGGGFVEAAADKGREVPAAVKGSYKQEMLLFFNLLREHNAEFGYRTSYEAARFIHFFGLLGGYPDGSADWFESAMDAVIVQKFLPKLHGSRSKLEGLLWALAWACGADRTDRDGKSFADQILEASQAQDDALYGPESLWDALSKTRPDNPAAAARYPLSYGKVMRMWRKLVRDQFVTFAEA